MNDFEAIAAAAVDPDKSFQFLQEQIKACGEDAEVIEAVYEALRSVTWQFVASRSGDNEVRRWADVVLRVRQLLRRRGSTIAERLTALYDMLDQTVRFEQLTAQRDRTNGRHVARILEVLDQANGPLPRSRLAEITGLKSANLSRIISNLAAERLVSRATAGREVNLAITVAGRALLRSTEDSGRDAPTVSPVAVFSGSAARTIVAELWPATGCSIAVWNPEGTLVACDSTFARIMGYGSAKEIEGLPQSAFLARLIVPDTLETRGMDEFESSDGRILRISKAESHQGALWACSDVTDYRNKIARLKSQERTWRRLARSRVHGIAHGSDGSARAQDAGTWALDILADHSTGLLSRVNTINSYAEIMRHEIYGDLGNSRYSVIASEIAAQSEQIRSLLGGITVVEDVLQNHSPRNLTEFEPQTVIREMVERLSSRGYGKQPAVTIDPNTAKSVHGDKRMVEAVVFPMLQSIFDAAEDPHAVFVVGADVRDGNVVVSARGPKQKGSPESWGPYGSVCRQVVNSYGGELHLRYGPNHSVEAIVSLPLKSEGRY